MRTIRAGWQRMAFGIAVAGALGFGATQAMAAPSEAEAEMRACGVAACRTACPQYGGTWVSGHLTAWHKEDDRWVGFVELQVLRGGQWFDQDDTWPIGHIFNG